MSHASIIVALSPADLERAAGETAGKNEDTIHAAVEYQMLPFDENGDWFKEGSRWDWWVIGGRFTGKFAPAGYDPCEDPANMETCWLCEGTGMRNDKLGRDQRKQDPAYKCNGCGGTGKSVKHPSNWVPTGNTVYRRELDEARLKARGTSKAIELWDRWEKEPKKDEFTRSYVYGIGADETREQYLERKGRVTLSAYAFLRDRKWNEQARLGWFGSDARTECEIKAGEEGKEFTGRCLHKDAETGAEIVSWTGPGDTEERWALLYWVRFVRNLPDDTLLVCVDYHV